MKKLVYSFAAIAALFATSCVTDATEEALVSVGAGDECTVTLSVNTGALGSRSINDGTKATKLQYAIYKAGGEFLFDGETTLADHKADVKVTLVKNNVYDFVFWAQSPSATCYNVAFKAGTVTVDYAKAEANDDHRDAFFGHIDGYTVNGPINLSIGLQRPFAQVNFATTDTAAAEKAGFDVANATTKFTTKACNRLDLRNGDASGDVDVEFTATVNPAEELELKSGAKYDWLAMNYILVPATETALSVCTMAINPDGANIEIKVPGAPVKRNWNTNLVGKLLTEDGNVEVTVEPGFEGEYVQEGIYVSNGVYHITNASGLQVLADEVAKAENNGLKGQTVLLEGDIDLAATRSASSNWTPVGTEELPFFGTFDGQGYTIKNLTIVETEAKEGKAYIGFFGYANNATIKNVTFENVNLNIACLDIDHSQGHIGAVAGSLEGTSLIENVTVKGDVFVEATVTANGASRVAVVAGGNAGGNVTMKNVHVVANEGSYLKANNNVGALAGQLQVKNVFENCSSNIDVTATKFFAGGLIGLAAGDSQFTNCHTTGDVTVTTGREGRANDQYRVGGIAGGWADGKTKVCTLTNCSYTGTVSGTNADGSVANPLDYLGYVGRGYTLTNCGGSKVVIDGVSFVQVGDAAPFGNYEVTGADGEAVVAAGSKEDLPKTDDGSKIDTNFDENVTLFGDITVSAKETNANSGYGATGVTVTDGAVLDGMGNTLTVTNAGGTWDCVVNAKNGTIKNLTVAGAFRGIFMGSATGDVYINNVIFKDVVYTFNSDGGNKEYGVYISNSTLNGWTSHSNVHKEVVYTNCKFGEGSGYAFCRPYGPTSFVGCAFEAGFEIHPLAAVTFENCTLGGVALTAENLATLVTNYIANATVK